MTNDKIPMTNESFNNKSEKTFLDLDFGFKRFIWILSFGFWILTAAPAVSVVDIGEIGVGARPLGMGSAYVGGLNDASAIFTNPAALALNQHLNIISMSGAILTDVNYLMFGASDQSRLGCFGFGYLNASVGAIPLTSITGAGSTAAVVKIGDTDYSSSVIYFSYGTGLDRIFQGKGDDISFGASLKLFAQGFSGGGSTMANATGGGMDADLGFLWQTRPWAKLGLTLINFLPQNFGGKFIWQKDNVVRAIPMATRLGGVFDLWGDETALFSRPGQNLDLYLDYEIGRGENKPATWHVGGEYWPTEVFVFRLGLDQKPKASTAGIGVDNNLTAGLGLKFSGFTFDYAYHRFGDLTENTSHFFSFGYCGQDKEEEQYLSKQKKSTLPVAQVASKPALITFSDVPAGFWACQPIEYLATLGIMPGVSVTNFEPNKPITRGELAVILVKSKDFYLGGPTKPLFTDVAEDNPLYPYISLVVMKQYMAGFADRAFRPDREITRAEAARIFAAFSGVYQKPEVDQAVYADVGKDFWAAPAIAAAKSLGLFEYISGDKFYPNADVTRAEVAEILSKTPTGKNRIKELLSSQK